MKNIVSCILLYWLFPCFAAAQSDPLLEKSQVTSNVPRESYIEFATFQTPNKRVQRSFTIPLDIERLKLCFDLSESAPTKVKPADAASEEERLAHRSRHARTIFGGPASGFEVHGHTILNRLEGDLPPILPRLKAEGFFTNVSVGESAESADAYQFQQSHIDAAIAWIRKVTEAHEKVANEMRLEAMTPFLLKNEIASVIDRFGTANEFTPPVKSFPAVHFTVYFQPKLEEIGAEPIIQRIVVVSSPSPLSAKAIRKKIGKPAVLIDDSGT